jgi:hypothetical protein
MVFTMACPNFKKGLKMAFGVKNCRASNYLSNIGCPHIQFQMPQYRGNFLSAATSANFQRGKCWKAIIDMPTCVPK